MLVELFYFEGCPNHQPTLGRLRKVLAEACQDTPVIQRRIDSPEQAISECFVGSPTIRINGEDIDPEGADRGPFGMSCRLYPGSSRPGVPDESMLRDVLGKH